MGKADDKDESDTAVGLRSSVKSSVITLIILVLILLLGGLIVHSHKTIYIGQNPVFVHLDNTDQTAIQYAVFAKQPTVPAGTKADVSIAQFTGTVAHGTVKYHGNYPSAEFIAVKDSSGWKVIDYGENGKFKLPTKAVAAQYNLPLGFYQY